MSRQKKTPPAATGGVSTAMREETQQDGMAGPGASQPAMRTQEGAASSNPMEAVLDDPLQEQSDDLAVQLKRPPGLAGMLADYIYANAKRPMMECAALGSLAILGGIAGRAFNYRDQGLSLYLLLLARTAHGKSATEKALARIYGEVRKLANNDHMDSFIGAGAFASGQAMVNNLSVEACTLNMLGEFGETLRNISSPRASGPEREIRRVLLDVYNRTGIQDILPPRKYADREKNTAPVRAPNLTVWAESTPEIIYDNLSHSDIRSGLLPRFVVLEATGPRQPKNPAYGLAPPEELVNGVRNLVEECWERTRKDECNYVRADSAALAYLAESEEEIEELMGEEATDTERELWSRAYQNIERIAALLAVGVNFKNPVIDIECAEWAVILVRHCVFHLSERFSSGFVGTGEPRLEAEVRKYVSDYVRMTPTQRSTYKVPAKLRQTGVVISLDYLKRRARRCNAFTQHPRGFQAAVDLTVTALVKIGFFMRVPPMDAYRRFDMRGEVFLLGNG